MLRPTCSAGSGLCRSALRACYQPFPQAARPPGPLSARSGRSGRTSDPAPARSGPGDPVLVNGRGDGRCYHDADGTVRSALPTRRDQPAGAGSGSGGWRGTADGCRPRRTRPRPSGDLGRYRQRRVLPRPGAQAFVAEPPPGSASRSVVRALDGFAAGHRWYPEAVGWLRRRVFVARGPSRLLARDRQSGMPNDLKPDVNSTPEARARRAMSAPRQREGARSVAGWDSVIVA